MLLRAVDLQQSLVSVYPFGTNAVLLVWNGTVPHEGKLRVVVNQAPVTLPSAAIRVDTMTGGHRSLMALRLPTETSRDAVIGLQDESGRPIADLPPFETLIESEDGTPLIEDLHPDQRLRVIRFVLEGSRNTFRLNNNHAFAQFCRNLVLATVPKPGRLQEYSLLTDRLRLYRGRMAPGIGRTSSVIVITSTTVRRNPFLPETAAAKTGRNDFDLVMEAPGGGDPAPLVVLLAETGVACRWIEMPAQRRSLLASIEASALAPESLAYVVKSLIGAAARDPQAAALARDAQIIGAQPARRLGGAETAIAASMALALGHDTGGVFVKGWLRDPYGVTAGMQIVSPLGVEDLPETSVYRFRGRDMEAKRKGDQTACGKTGDDFVAFVPNRNGPVPVHQYYLRLKLASGEPLDLAAPAQPADLREARQAVLASVPAPLVTKAMLTDCIAPALGNLHRAIMRQQREPEIAQVGTPVRRPSVSIIIPLFRNLRFLRFQIAAFAIDPAMIDAELIFVLDSPEQQRELEHLLHGLHAVYGLPMKLVVMSANFGYAAANNTGARHATGRHLLFLNSDVVPDRPGWIGMLTAALEAVPGCGVVGPKLLFDDGSIQHAGLYFGTDLKGESLNRHYYKGFPRDFGPANVLRSVPGVTGAAMLMRRRLFQKVGGFAEDYVIGDYEDSDLCLKVRSAGYDIRYVPAVELFHFERRSIELHDGYARTIASEYNRWLHTLRWSASMEDVMHGTSRKPRRGASAAAAV